MKKLFIPLLIAIPVAGISAWLLNLVLQTRAEQIDCGCPTGTGGLSIPCGCAPQVVFLSNMQVYRYVIPSLAFAAAFVISYLALKLIRH